MSSDVRDRLSGVLSKLFYRAEHQVSDVSAEEARVAAPAATTSTPPTAGPDRQVNTWARKDIEFSLPGLRAHLKAICAREGRELAIIQREHNVFLCFGAGEATFAVKVPCFYYKRLGWPKIPNPGGGPGRWFPIGLADLGFESDASVFQRMRREINARQGILQRWLPFWGISKVQEVQFHWHGRPTASGLYPVVLRLPDLENVRLSLERFIKFVESRNEEHVLLDCRHVEGVYDPHCVTNSFSWKQCEAAQLVAFDRRLAMLKHIGIFKDCIKNPHRAEGWDILQGIVCERLVYSTDERTPPDDAWSYYGGLDLQTGALHVTMGWQTHEMKWKIPAIFGFICLCIFLWRGAAGSWSDAFTLGNLITAMIALAFVVSQHST